MSNLVRLMVEHWKYYVILQRDKHAQELRADVHFSASLLPKYFNLWTQYVQYRQWKYDINQQAANQFRSASILYNASKFFWYYGKCGIFHLDFFRFGDILHR